MNLVSIILNITYIILIDNVGTIKFIYSININEFYKYNELINKKLFIFGKLFLKAFFCETFFLKKFLFIFGKLFLKALF
uniref:Uncharacterized protein n=1 Tax=viral metagenome TaxID=1070528 RepID=A0A6C0D500_9ZZZZ